MSASCLRRMRKCRIWRIVTSELRRSRWRRVSRRSCSCGRSCTSCRSSTCSCCCCRCCTYWPATSCDGRWMGKSSWGRHMNCQRMSCQICTSCQTGWSSCSWTPGVCWGRCSCRWTVSHAAACQNQHDLQQHSKIVIQNVVLCKIIHIKQVLGQGKSKSNIKFGRFVDFCYSSEKSVVSRTP